MDAILLESTGKRRVFEVIAASRTYWVEYRGSLRGVEFVSVDGEVVTSQQRPLGFVLRFRFSLGPHPALLEVRVWPWLSLRAVHLWVDDEVLYAEGKGLLQSPADSKEQEFLERGRMIAAIMFTCGVAGVGLNLMMFLACRGFFLEALVVTPMCLLLGIGGLIDPRLCLPGNHGQGLTLPRWTKVVGNTLLVVGLAVGVALLIVLDRNALFALGFGVSVALFVVLLKKWG